MRLVAVDREILVDLVEDTFGSKYGVELAEDWIEDRDALKWMLGQFESGAWPLEWPMVLFLLAEEPVVIGAGGYKGGPHDGTVEIGYGVATAYRGQGLATEAARELVAYALEQDRQIGVTAKTLPEESASTHVLEKCGFRRDGEMVDPSDGPVWCWRYETGPVNFNGI